MDTTTPTEWIIIPLQTFTFAIPSHRIEKALPPRLDINKTKDIGSYIETLPKHLSDSFMIVGDNHVTDLAHLKSWTVEAGNTFFKFLLEYVPMPRLASLISDPFLYSEQNIIPDDVDKTNYHQIQSYLWTLQDTVNFNFSTDERKKGIQECETLLESFGDLVVFAAHETATYTIKKCLYPENALYFTFDYDECLCKGCMLQFTEKNMLQDPPGSLTTLVISSRNLSPKDDYKGMFINNDLPFHAVVLEKNKNTRSCETCTQSLSNSIKTQ